MALDGDLKKTGTYPAVSRISFETFEGVEGSLARAFLGLSRVGLMSECHQNKKNRNIRNTIPRHKCIIIIRVTVCNGTFLPTSGFGRRGRRRWGDFYAVE